MTSTTKAQSNATTAKTIRYGQITKILKEAGGQPLTARDITLEMIRRGWVPVEDPNFARPRITELVQAGAIIKAGTRWDGATRRNVTAYKLAPADGNGQLRMEI